MIPGGNIMAMATRVIAQQQFTYIPYVTRTLMPNGNWAATYDLTQQIMGSVQPVPRSLYAVNGLDFQKSYYNFFMQQDAMDVTRDVSGDMFQFQGNNFQALSKTPWFGIDGWIQILTILVP
jgi:hypothetical protein